MKNSKIKENNLYLLEQVKEREPEKFLDVAKRYLKTPTDVMRYAVTLVGGDPSLNGKMKDQIEIRGPWGVRSTKTIGFSFSKNPKYLDDTRNLKGSEIKEVLALLANTRMEIGSDYPEIEKMIKENARKEGRSDDIILVDDAVQTYAQYYKSLAKVAHLNPNDKSQVNRVLGAICSNKTSMQNYLTNNKKNFNCSDIAYEKKFLENISIVFQKIFKISSY